MDTTTKSFAALWQRDGWRHALPAAGLSVAATILAATPLAVGLITAAAGWPLAAIAGVGLLAGLGWRAVKATERAIVLETYARDKAPQTMQAIAENLFLKAGLACKPDLRLLNADTPGLRGMQRSVCIVSPTGWHGARDNGTVPVLVGRQVAGLLNAEEMTAVLAHATARVMVRPHAVGPSYKIGRLVQLSVLTASLLTLNIPVFTLCLAASLVRRGLAAQSRLVDDTLADRNAVALYPKPLALVSGSGKVREVVLDAHRSAFSSFRQAYRALGNRIYAALVLGDRREAVLAASLKEACAFNAQYSLPPDGRDVLPPALQAAWQAERTPSFWERVRLFTPPSTSAPKDETKPPPDSLRSLWNAHTEGPASSCRKECDTRKECGMDSGMDSDDTGCACQSPDRHAPPRAPLPA